MLQISQVIFSRTINNFMLIGRGLHKVTQLAEEYKITSKMGKLIEKKPNTTHTPGQTMKTILKDFSKIFGYTLFN